MQDPVARMLSAHRMTRAARCRGAREPCAFPTFAEAVNATLSRRRGDDCLFQTPVCSPSLGKIETHSTQVVLFCITEFSAADRAPLQCNARIAWPTLVSTGTT